MSKIAAPGVYEMRADQYHADPAPEPSLSRGIAHLLVRRTPRHAHYAHPRLGGGTNVEISRVMDDGSAVHALMLGRSDEIKLMTTRYGEKHKKAGQLVTDYKTEAATTERDAIRSAGGIPVLPSEFGRLKRCADAALADIAANPDCTDFLAPGKSEAVVIWQEDGFWFRIMVDRLPDRPGAAPFDVKATELSAAPGAWERRLQLEYSFQDAFYCRGIRKVFGVTPEPMRFIVAELREPFAGVCMTATPALRAIAEAEVERAIRLWRECLTADRWPGYPPFTAHVDAPAWLLMQHEARQLQDEFVEDHAPEDSRKSTR